MNRTRDTYESIPFLSTEGCEIDGNQPNGREQLSEPLELTELEEESLPHERELPEEQTKQAKCANTCQSIKRLFFGIQVYFFGFDVNKLNGSFVDSS